MRDHFSSWIVPLHAYRIVATDPTGGGDTVGEYVPVGRELHPPIVCVHDHTHGALLPIASSMSAALALDRAGREWMHVDDDVSDGDELGRLLQRAWLADDLPAASVLAVDPDSPLVLVHAARQAIAGRDSARAVALADRALAILPEYGEAWSTRAAALAGTDRAASTTALARALRSPLAFSWSLDRPRLVAQLKRASVDIDDTLFARRTQLTGAMQVGDPSDAIALEAAADDDLARGQPELAMTALMTAGELMYFDTSSCRERRGWSEKAHLDRMRSACTGSLASRAALLDR